MLKKRVAWGWPPSPGGTLWFKIQIGQGLGFLGYTPWLSHSGYMRKPSGSLTGRNMLGHDNVTGDEEVIAHTHLFQRALKQLPYRGRTPNAAVYGSN